ncbi:TlpA family protein disulfide reductase [Streptomyces sp. NPDC059786]|uniref:TlpA family protein disulfide reductase n=1 Tax=Streptomyces sp. NPDC059786 TaxID=3346946 RepID=UPI00365C674A
MTFLLVLTVFVGLLCTLDLLLTLGVIKRLREHTELLAAARSAPPAAQVGDTIGEFHTVAVDGSPVGADALRGETLVGFFSPTCRPCQEKLPSFAELAAARGGRRAGALAVVVTEEDDAAEFVAALEPVARVVVEQRQGPVGRAFKAHSFPTVLMVESDGERLPVVTDSRVALDVPAGTSA